MFICVYTHFPKWLLIYSTPAHVNWNLFFLHETFTIEMPERGSTSLSFIPAVTTWQWTELCSCCFCCKIWLVLSVSKTPDPCDLCLDPFFMGSEEKWTISIDLRIIIRSLLHLRTLRIIESHPSAGNLQLPVGSFTLVHKSECILGYFRTSSEASEMGYTWGQ